MVSAANFFFIRKSSLGKLSGAELRQEITAGGVNEYLMKGRPSGFDSLPTVNTNFQHIRIPQGKGQSRGYL